jgi:catalase
MVGNNTPVFFLRDAIKFPDFIHSQKKNPRTNLPDPAAIYEFWANHPQSLHQMTILMSDRGIPASYRHMHGFSSHTFSFWNEHGERFWFKWHFKSNQGIKNLSNEESAQMLPFGAQQDLLEAIDNGDFPSWTAKVQIMTEAEAQNYKINPFDLTKIWPHVDFPLIEVGQLELNRNVENYFAETEQACFAPSNLVPGIGASPDKMLQGRLLAYQDAHRYRVGANANQLPVNAAKCPVHHYQRDGAMAGVCPAHGDMNIQSSDVNYYPNDQINKGAPVPQPMIEEPPMPIMENAWVKRHGFDEDEDHYSQAGDLFRLMDDSQKSQLTTTISQGLVNATESVQRRMLEQFNKADPEYATRIETIMNVLKQKA